MAAYVPLSGGDKQRDRNRPFLPDRSRSRRRSGVLHATTPLHGQHGHSNGVPAEWKYAASRSTNTRCATTSLLLARSRVNHATRSTSGNARTTPDPVGHASENVHGAIASGPSSPRSANAVTTLPPDCRPSPSDTSLPSGGGMPSSSVNSRRAAASGPSSLPYSPFGTVQAPAS